MNSIGAGFAPDILKGPLGYGAIDNPVNMLWYSPPSGLLIIKMAVDSPILEGSYLKLMETSFPSKESLGGAFNVAASTEKSTWATGPPLALGSTGPVDIGFPLGPNFSTLQL